MGPVDLPRHTTPEPSQAIRDGAAEVVKRLGGRAYPKAIHADRVVRDEETDRTIGLAECGHRGTLVDLPPTAPRAGILNKTAVQTGVRQPVRLCTICDAVPRMPRIIKEARKVTGV